MAELEACVAIMAWDWSGGDIAEDEDNGKIWIPVVLQGTCSRWISPKYCI